MQKRRIAVLAFAALVAATVIARAQIATTNEFATYTTGKTVVGMVQMVWNAALGYAQPVSSANPLPVSVPNGTDIVAYAQGASANPTMNFVTGSTLYVTGLVVTTTSSAVTETTVLAQINGILGGAMGVAVTVPANGGYATTSVQFARPIPASAVSSSIFVSGVTITSGSAITYLQGFYK